MSEGRENNQRQKQKPQQNKHTPIPIHTQFGQMCRQLVGVISCLNRPP